MKNELIDQTLKTTSEPARRLSVIRRGILFAVVTFAALAGTSADWAPLPSARAQSGGSWTTKADMPTARAGLGAVTIDGKLYAVGGNPDATNRLSTLEVYDPTTNLWAPKTDMPTARYGFGTAALNGKLYAVGGFGGGAVKLEVFNPATDTWETKADLPIQAYQLAAAAIDGKLYAVGGTWTGIFNSLWVYDPATDTWDDRANMPTPRHSLAAAAINGKLYVVGGINGGALNTLEVYDPANDTWETRASMPTARAGMAAAALNGKLYVVGGYYKLEVYDPATDAWTTEADLPTWREGLGAAAIDGKLYAVGGVNGDRLTTLEVFNPTPPCQAITVDPATGALPSGSVGTSYSQQFTQVGGTGAIVWSIDPIIPGLSIDSSGLLSGTPTTAGTYNFSVTATSDNNCSGSTGYTLIVKADQSITFGALANKTFGDAPFAVTATASSSLPVSFSATGNCTVSGNTVTITGAGSCTITAAQAGDANYNAAPDVAQSFTIAKATATLLLGSLEQTYNGTPRSVTVTTNPANLTGVSVTYNGSATVPTNAGSYTVVASLNNANYQAANATGILVIAKASQTITFGNLANKTFGDAPFTLSATASSGLPVSFSATGTCTVSGNTVTITGAGTCTITASQAGNINYNAAPNVSRSFTIAKANQTITFAALANKTFGDAPFTVSATASSGLAVSFTASGTCTISGNTVTITGAGTCTITASQSGNTNYNAAPNVSRSFTIAKAAATLTLGNLDQTYNGTSRSVTVTTNPANLTGVSVTYNNSMTVPTNAGSYAVVASLNNANYQATNATGTLVIAKANQTVTLAALANKTFGDASFAVSATATSGLAVTFSATGNCTVSNTTVTLTGAGTCTITAAQAGSTNYNAATPVPQSFTIAKANQTITFSTVGNKTFGDAPFTLNATASSGLPVSFAASGPCTVSGSTVTITGVGTCTITASQAGNTNYNAATSVQRSFTIAKANQTITFGTLQNKTFGDAPFALTATASSGLPVSYSAVGPCTVSGSTATITGAGTCTITASQSGNTNYNAAANVSRSFTIAKANQTITFATLANKTFGNPPFTVSATASSGLAVSFAASGPCTISANTVTITGAGTCTITASQAGNTNYNATTSVSRSFTIAKANQTITFATLPNKTFGDAPFAVNATASSGLVVSFTASGTCTISGNTVTLTASGTCTITASQAGNANYNAAPSVAQSFTVAPVSNCPRITLTPGTLSGGAVGVSYTVNFFVSGGTPDYRVSVSGLPLGLTYSAASRYTRDISDRPILTISGTPVQAGIFSVQVTITDSTGCAVTNTYTLNIAKGTPVITWGYPDNILYPTPLSSTQLNATVNAAGTLIYSPAAGTILPLGYHTLTVNFTPTDLTNWNTAARSVTIRVVDSLNACPTISLSLPRLPDGAFYTSYYVRVDVRGGQGPYVIRVSGLPSGLSARISSSYVEITGRPLQAGNFSVQIDVTDRNGCTNAGLNLLPLTIINVRGTPTITWNPADIACNTPLGSAQLNATANVPGTFVYTPAAGTILAAGSQTLSVEFTPTDTTNWNSVRRTVTIDVGLPFFTLNPTTTIFTNTGSYRTFTIADMVAAVTDGCTVLNTDVVVIDRVTSDEEDNASGRSDLETINDIVIAADCKSVQLRQEYDRLQDGRVYRIRLRILGLNRTAVYRVEVPGRNGAVAGQERLVKVGNCGS